MFELCSQASGAARLRQAGLAGLLLALLPGVGGCSSRQVIGPAEDFFHGLEGGVIAQQRPPPPGADDPYPNLATVPARPTAPDVLAQQRIADRLASQRDEAGAVAAQDPLKALAPAAPPPKPAAPDANANRMVVDAAAAPPAPAPEPVPTPQPAPAAAAPEEGIAAVPAVPALVASGPLPTLAAAPPPLAIGLGGAPPPSASPTPTVQASAAPPLAPHGKSPAAPPATAGVTAPAAAPVTLVAVAFTPGSDELPPSAPLTLRRFALAHKGTPLTVTGHGGVVLPTPDAQSRALDLGLRRAQAIAASLATAGVPSANLRLRAEAAGQGGTASL